MEKTLKRLQPAMMKALRERYGEAEANDHWTGLESQFNRWLREEGNLGSRKNMMSSNMMLCYAVCAFYEAMDRELTREQFDMMVEDAMAASFRRMGIINMNRLYRNGTLMKLCHSFVQRYTKKVGKPRHARSPHPAQDHFFRGRLLRILVCGRHLPRGAGRQRIKVSG